MLCEPPSPGCLLTAVLEVGSPNRPQQRHRRPPSSPLQGPPDADSRPLPSKPHRPPRALARTQLMRSHTVGPCRHPLLEVGSGTCPQGPGRWWRLSELGPGGDLEGSRALGCALEGQWAGLFLPLQLLHGSPNRTRLRGAGQAAGAETSLIGSPASPPLWELALSKSPRALCIWERSGIVPLPAAARASSHVSCRGSAGSGCGSKGLRTVSSLVFEGHLCREETSCCQGTLSSLLRTSLHNVLGHAPLERSVVILTCSSL